MNEQREPKQTIEPRKCEPREPYERYTPGLLVILAIASLCTITLIGCLIVHLIHVFQQL